MIFALLFIILLFCVFTGVGFAFASVFKIKIRNNPFLLFFIGFSLSGLYFLAVSIFSPLNIATLAPVIFLGGIYFLLLLKKLSLRAWWDKKYFVIFLFVIFLLVLAEVSSSGFGAYDTLLYHANVVSWMNSYKAVFGLANLHYRLGLNSLYLALASGIDVGMFDRASGVVLPVLTFLASVGFFLWEMCFSTDRKYKTLAFGMLIWLVFTTNLTPNLYYDTPSQLFIALTFFELLHFFEESEIEKRISLLSVIMLFSAVSFVIKPIGALNLIFVSGICLYFLVKNKLSKFKTLAKIFLFPILLGIFYVWRNLILTGYPLYPLPVLRFNFLWTIPSDIIKTCYFGIQEWAKAPCAMYIEGEWFVPWLKLQLSTINSLYFVMFFASIVIWLKQFLYQNKKEAILIFFMLVLNILFWFLSAPSFRFASVFFFLLFFISLVFYGSEKLEKFASFAVFSYIFLLSPSFIYFTNKILLISSLILLFFGLTKYLKERTLLTFQIIFICIIFFITQHIRIDIDFTNIPRVQSCLVHKVVLKNNQEKPLSVWTPNSGDRCGNSPLPCTPYVNNSLKLIKPDDISKGFYF